MAVSTNERAISTFYEVWNTGNVALLDELYAPDIKYHISVFPDMDLAALKQFVAAVRVSQSDFNAREDERIVEGDRAYSRWTATSTFTGDSQLLPGIAPTGKRQTTWGTTTYRWRNGKVVEVWHAVDLLSWYMQQGVIPPMG